MGVPGLWDLLRPAATRTSLSTLAKTAFQTSRHGLRSLTIGIDASLWIFHAQIPTAGENPFLRTIFFKVCTLLQQPVLPVFVFDGPNKPSMKRGQRVAGQFGTADRRSLEFKALLNECGLEWWNAPGEAEAELAVMNRQGKIDAVLSDVDALLFGATCVLRNNSPTLSGTQGSSSNALRGDLRTYEIYRSSAIHSTWTGKTDTALKTEEECRMAMIFVALLAGGDYVPEGIEAFGPTIAFALAHAGMSDTLSHYNTHPSDFTSSLPSLQARIVEELRTNASGHVGRRYPDRASKLAKRSDLLSSSALQSYLQPITSPVELSAGWPGFGLGESSRTRGKARNGGRGEIEGMARASEKYFEWGTRELVVKKFASESIGVFGAEIMASARKRRMELDQRDALAAKPSLGSAILGNSVSQSRMTSFFGITASPSSSSQPKASQRPVSPTSLNESPDYILRIERTRPDPTNPDLTEYRLLYETKHLVERVHGAMRGTRIDPKHLTPEERLALGMVEAPEQDDVSERGEKEDNGQARVWIADWLLRQAWPGVVEEWEKKQAAKVAKPAGKGRMKSAGTGTPKKTKPIVARPAADGEDVRGFINYFSATQAAKVQTQRSRSPSERSRVSSTRRPSSEEEGEEIELIESSRPARSSSISTSPDPDLLVLPSQIARTKPRSLSSPRMGPKSPIRPTSPRRTKRRAGAVSARPLAPTRTTRSAPGSGSNFKPIEILSSDTDNDKAPLPAAKSGTMRRTKVPILVDSSRQNTLSPPAISNTRTKGPTKSKSKTQQQSTQTTQTRLSMPIIASRPDSTPKSLPTSSASDKPLTPPPAAPAAAPASPGKSRSGARASSSPIPDAEKKGSAKPRRSYVVKKTWEEHGVEVIDCTRGGRLERR